MKTKQISVLLASIMATNSMAFALTTQSSMDQLSTTQTQVDPAELIKMLDKADQQTVEDMMMTYNEVQKLAESLRKIQNSNEADPVLAYANKAQVVLIGASTIALKSHITNKEKASFQLQIAAATALLNSFIRHYAEIKNLKPDQVGVFISNFTHEMVKDKILAPEVAEMADSLNLISNQLIQQKSQIDTLVKSLGGGSDMATAAIILLALAHYISPKLAKESDTILRSLTQKMATGGAVMAQDSKVVGASGLTAGLPDIVGITLGLDSQKSQEMITMTLNNLDIASRKLEAAIRAKK